MRLANADNFILRELAGRFYLVNVKMRGYFCAPLVLNETGADILIPLLRGGDADDSAEYIASEYGIGLDEAKSDVYAFLEQMAEAGLELVS